MLNKTVAEVDALVISEPEYDVWIILQQQLHYMQYWSANNASSNSGKPNAVSIGLIAARELEPASQEWMQDLIDRLHSLSYYWRYWPTEAPTSPTAPTGRTAPKTVRIFAVLILVAAAGGVALIGILHSVFQTKMGPPVPHGQSIHIAGSIATLTTSLEPYAISLNRNPENARYLVQLRLVDSAGKKPDRFISIARHLQNGDLHFGAKLLGDDGHRLWFYVKSIGAWEYRQGKIVTVDDLRHANPSLGKFSGKDNTEDPLISKSVRRVVQPSQDLWNGEARLYAFDKHLRVATPDFQRVFDVDPVTLQAIVK